MNDEQALVAIEQEHHVLPEGYYRNRESGKLKYVTGFDHVTDTILYLHGCSECGNGDKITKFLEEYEFCPNGAEIRQQQYMNILHEVGEMSLAASDMRADLSAYSPHVNGEEVVGLSLVKASEAGTPEAAKQQLAHMRNSVAKTQNLLKQKQAQIQAIVDEQTAIIGEKIGGLKKVLARAEEMIYTINLYMGKDEVINTLRTGESASAEAPIYVRQRVLYMDEECAVKADTGGIDYYSVEEFDKWILEDPTHLQQIFPEPKGVVCLKVRRNDKDYGNREHNLAMQEANKVTYFLIRNGENLYRLWTEFDVGEVLIPREDEFAGFFKERKYTSGGYEMVDLEPGSRDYMKAMEKADAHRRHYLRVGLILQGLIDRTPIFRPAAERVVVTDPAMYGRALVLVTDMEKALPDGRERFVDWLQRLNSNLQVGTRVIGVFHTDGHMGGDWLGNSLGRYNYDKPRRYGTWNSRLAPERAGFPYDYTLYTLDKREDSGFRFKYERQEKRYNYSTCEDEPYTRQASCKVYCDDTFILNFDAATIEEMEFYINCRTDREHYTVMIPLLRTAIRMKREETEYERPFKQLVAGTLVTRFSDVDLVEAEEATDMLVSWWKFKNRNHRAISADDKAAFDMIIEEFSRLRKEQDRRNTLRVACDGYERTVNIIKDRVPNALTVSHMKDNSYSVLVPANGENVYVHQQIWLSSSHGTRCKEVREWRIIDPTWKLWETLYESPRWKQWNLSAAPADYLTDPEKEELIRQVVPFAMRRMAPRRRDVPRLFLPLVAGTYQQQTIRLWFIRHKPEINMDNPLTGEATRDIHIEYLDITWKRTGHGENRKVVIEDWDSNATLDGPDHWPWLGGGQWKQNDTPLELHVVWHDNIQTVAEWFEENAKVRAYHTQLRNASAKVGDSISKQYAEWNRKQTFHKFILEHGDPDLWEGHLKTLRLPEYYHNKALGVAIATLVERGINLHGKTVGEILGVYSALPDAKPVEVEPYIQDFVITTSSN